MKILYRCAGEKDLEIEVFTKLALEHITKVLIKHTEKLMPLWAEIMYFFVDKIY